MNILVTGANGQLGNEMRIISKESTDKYIFTDVNRIEGLETTYLDITDLDAIRTMVKDNNVQAIVNCAAWTNVDGCMKLQNLIRLITVCSSMIQKVLSSIQYGLRYYCAQTVEEILSFIQRE